MSIKMRCNCGIDLVVPTELLGQQVRCPECNDVMTVAAAARGARPGERREQHQGLEETRAVLQDQQETAEAPPAAADDPAWLFRTPEGQEFGPITRIELDSWVREGRVSHDCELAEIAENHVDDIEWRLASVDYPMLIESGNPFGPRGVDDLPTHREPHRGGILLLVALVGCFIPFVSILGAVLGTRDLRRMQSGKMEPSGESITRAGQIIATVATMVWMAAFAVGLLVLLTRAMNR